MPMAIISRLTRKSVACLSPQGIPAIQGRLPAGTPLSRPCLPVLARAGIDTRYPRGETPRHEPLRPLETTGSPAHQRGLSADDGATASHGMVAAEVFRWADS